MSSVTFLTHGGNTTLSAPGPWDGKNVGLNCTNEEDIRRLSNLSSSAGPQKCNYADLNNVNQVENKGQAPRKFPPGVSLLAGKYLMFPEPNTQKATFSQQQQKPEISCVNIETKQQFTCKIVPRSTKGLAMLAAYHRLEECSEFINQVIEAILTPKTLYLIMPKHFGNVHAYILEKPLGEAEAANLFIQMLKIVQHCHDNGVILRDIKMGRFVFVDKDKRKIKLESLEDATLLVDPSNDNLDDNYGCPNYVSPEKAETLRTKLRYPGKASDIWCLGVILYTMLSGRYPFNDPNQSKLLNKIRAGNFTIPSGLSSSVTFLIKTLLRKSPAERPSCKEILRSSWLSKHCVSTTIFMSEANADPKESNEASDITEVPHKYAVHCQLANDQVVPNF